MNELIEGFLKAAQSKDDKLSITKMLSKEEVFQWEVLVKAMDTIDILNVGRDLEKVQKTYQLERWQEMSILAYVKVLEMMIKRAKDFSAGVSDELPLPEASKPTEDLYSGSMFG
tara:strand:+ start:616 stop:957 length:342 start_codon:yes stop_codon:yes gene_type:complete